MDTCGNPEATEAEVQVDLYGGFKEAAGTKSLKVKLPGDGTVKELLQHLVASYGARFEYALLEEDGALKYDAVLLLNRAVLSMRDLDKTLMPGDNLALYQTISGG